jgi:anti-anti-sigma factor
MDTDAELTLVRHERVGEHLVVHVTGELDLSCVEPLTFELDQVLEIAAGAPVDLDLAAVTFIDAATLGVLARFGAKAKDAGSTVTVVELRPFHRRIFELVPCETLLVAP